MLGVLALLLLWLGRSFVAPRDNSTVSVEYYLSWLVEPFYWAASVPESLFSAARYHMIDRQQLVDDNAALAEQVLLLRAQLQALGSLETENQQLRHLLNASEKVADQVLVARWVGMSPDPMRHEIIIDKGLADGLYVGQPVIDATGLMGQVIRVGPHYSRVLLVSDVNHAVPVHIHRNGVRSIVEGVGLYDQLDVQYIAATTDIQVGDHLYTSGLGERFPVEYPVATVTSVHVDPGQSFAKVTAKPEAELMRGRYVLLVFTEPAVALSAVEDP